MFLALHLMELGTNYGPKALYGRCHLSDSTLHIIWAVPLCYYCCNNDNNDNNNNNNKIFRITSPNKYDEKI